MKTALFKLGTIVLILTACGWADVSRYTGTLKLDPAAGTLKADIRVTVTAGDKELPQDVFYLNKGLRIESIKCRACSAYNFDVARTNEVQFVPSGVPLTLTFKHPLKPGEHAEFRVRYSGQIVPDTWGTNVLSADWTELALYSGWYPFHRASAAYRFDIRVEVDPAYKVTGNGEVSGGAGAWRLVENEPTMDMVVVASRNLKTRTLERGGMQLRIDAAGVPDAAVAQFADDTADMVAHYSQWYGPATMKKATFVLNRRPTGGGYVRPRFMSLPYTPDQLKWLGHEVGHFWWTGASVESWEDWLNESFAEYSTVRYVREVKGEAEFAQLVKTARERSAGKPAIWGIARTDPTAHEVLYDKGLLRLLALEDMIGKEKFTAFVATLHRDHIKNTAAALQTLQQQTSVEVRQKFEAMLKEQ